MWHCTMENYLPLFDESQQSPGQSDIPLSPLIVLPDFYLFIFANHKHVVTHLGL